MKIFRDSISLFDIALFEKESCDIVKTLWGDVGKEKNIDFEELNKIRKRYLPSVKDINDDNISDIDPKILSHLLWFMDESPLILRKHENVEKGIQLCPGKKFILVGECKYEEWMKTYSVFQNLSNLNSKPELRDTIMQNFTISIQGKEELNLVTAFGDNGEFLENVRTDHLIEMLNGPFPIDGEKETLPEPYVERYLSRNIVNFTYLEKVHENTIIIMNWANNFDIVKDKLDKCQLIDIDNFLQKKNHTAENLTNEACVLNSGPNRHTANFDLNKSSSANKEFVGHRKKIQYDEFNNENRIYLDKSKFGLTIYAEYLIATYLTKNVSEFKDIITDTIFHAKYDNVRFFFDMLIAKNSKAHIAVLYKNYELLRTYDDKILKGKDEGGRNALHLISSWGRRHPRVTLTVVNEEYIVHEANNFVEKPETEAYFETITYLQGKNDVRERDVLLDTTPLSYAIRSESLGAELKLLQIKINELTKLCSTKDLINILFYCAKFGYEDVCKFFRVSELKNFWCKTKVVTAKGAKTLLLLACQNGNLNIVKDFVRCGATAHCTASPTRHKSVDEYLSTVDTEINRADNDGVTPLFVASLNGHQTVVEHLVTIGAEINRATNNGLTSLHIASFLVVQHFIQPLDTVTKKL
ncbi:uncharacterized protein LOC135121582 [Zophobas morio]|uniref:uncharacterized protein LOC135121582 n=1 Tax=Zophobas morio TaxID=2755281 RepID=UPI003082CF28